MIPLRAAILTISDRSFKGSREDLSGPAIYEQVTAWGWQVLTTSIVPDEIDDISAQLITWIDNLHPDIILTTGGTGVAPRDVTPEATLQVIEKQVPGIAEFMRQESYKVTPHAMLSWGIAGIRKKTLIVNLPGSPKAAIENLSSIRIVLPHAIELLQESPGAEQGHHASART